MYISIFLLPIMAVLSLYAFQSVGWTVRNFEGNEIPYSLGVVVLFSFSLLTDFQLSNYIATSKMALVYIVIIWIIGFVDDLLGADAPKGIKGHLKYLWNEKEITTGIIKIIGTAVAAFYMVLIFEPDNLITALRYFFLLFLFPHLTNLLDTRPLRVWKVSLVFWFILLAYGFTPSFTIVVYLLTVLYILLIMEGHRIAMLGDNGATTVGAIFALWTITIATPQIQWLIIGMILIFMLLAERISLTTFIERRPLLNWFDQLGLFLKKPQ
ncbi:hypothetical protein BTS2_0713 [Bacillus sp. TS-2]|nr:hypothetical protein BTS2_0713 [Bacillus sp. TS-2]